MKKTHFCRWSLWKSGNAMEDVKVAYIPFDYAQLTQQEVENLPQSKTRSTAVSFTEKSPYTVTYENYEVTDGGPTGPVTFQLPILYTVWPAEKPLPDDLEYVVDYEVFLPHSAAGVQSAGALLALEREAVSAALGIDIIPDPGDPIFVPPTPQGYVYVYDDELNRNVPMNNLLVRCRFGSNIYDVTTNKSGHFSIMLPFLPSGLMYPDVLSATLTFTYSDPSTRWKITPENSTSPLTVGRSITFSKVSGVYEYGVVNITLSSSARQENEIHRAATYFYNGQNDFPRHTVSGGMKIIANNVPGDGANGSFGYPSRDINIYNNGNSDGRIIGTTLHEMGHFVHYVDNPDNYKRIPDFLGESFAEYSGWYFGEEYYASLGWPKPTGLVTIFDNRDIDEIDITGCARQKWTKNSLGNYSPLFVDLADPVNQRTYIPGIIYLDDDLEGMPPSVIWNIITTSISWAQCRSKLQSYVGTYYTTADFNNWIADFDYWFAN